VVHHVVKRLLKVLQESLQLERTLRDLGLRMLLQQK
jgi:hypothetical protein